MMAACGSAPAPAISHAKPAERAVRVAVAKGRTVRIVELAAGNAIVQQTAHVPLAVFALDWLGSEPVVLLEHRNDFECDRGDPDPDCTADPAHDGVIGRITGTGFVPYAALPPATWSDLDPQPADSNPCTSRCWQIVVRDKEVWQAHCKWTFQQEGSPVCDRWSYARIDRPDGVHKSEEAFAALLKSAPEPAPEELPDIAPSPRVKIDYNAVETNDGSNNQLTCSLDGKPAVVYPPADRVDRGMGEPTWLATSPPIFTAVHTWLGFEMHMDAVVFEECKPDPPARIQRDRGGLVTIVGSTKVTVIRNGQLLGVIPGSGLVAVAP